MGQVDIHPRAVAEEVGLTVDQVRAALDELESPDPESRSPEAEGRRIIRLDEHRAGGWQIVNYVKYRDIKTEDDRREQNRIAQAKWRETHKKSSAPVSTDKQPSAVLSDAKPESAQSAHIDVDVALALEAEALKPSMLSHAPARPSADPPQLTLVEGSEKPPTGPPDCPHLAVLALWAEVLPAMPQHQPGLWRGSRSSHLRARWRETAAEKGWTTEAQGLAYLRKLFGFVGQSRFLTGQARPTGPDKRPFFIELEWLVSPSNWAKTIEGKYHAEESTA